MKPDNPAPEPLTRKDALKTILKSSAKIFLVLNAAFIIFLLFFIGSAWQPADQYKRVHIAIANYDSPGGIVGDQLIATLDAGLAANRLLRFSYHLINASETSYEELRSRIDQGHFHAGYIVVPGASDALFSAFSAPDAQNKSPPSLLHFSYDEGRGGVALAAVLKTAGFGFFTQFNSRLAAALAGASLAPASPLRNAPVSLLGRPLTFFEDKIHSVPYQGAANLAQFTWAVLYVITFFVNLVINGIWGGVSAKAPIRRDHILLCQLAHMFFFTFFLSLWPISVVAWLGMEIDGNKYFQMWWFMYLAQAVFSLFTLSLTTVIGFGPALGASVAFFVLNIISSSATYPTEFMNPFFKIGYGLPMYQGASGTRTILFGSYDRLDRNIGLLFLWLGVLLFIFGIGWVKAHRAVQNALQNLPTTNEKSDEKSEEGEGDKSQKQAPAVGTKSFFDPAFSPLRKNIKKPIILTTVIFNVTFLILLLFFIGASWHPEEHYGRFKIAVADYDGGILGNSLENVVQKFGKDGTRELLEFSYKIIDTNQVSVEQLRSDVSKGKYSAAYWIPPSSSSLLNSLTTDKDFTANPRAVPFKFTFDEGRAGGLVAALMRRSAQDYLYRTNGLVSAQLNADRRANPNKYSDAPTDLNLMTGRPLVISEDNLHPVTEPGANNLAGQVWIIILGMGIPLGMISVKFMAPLQQAGVGPFAMGYLRYVWILAVSLTLTFWPPVIVRGLGFYMTGATFFECWAMLWFVQFIWAGVNFLLAQVLAEKAAPFNMILLILSLISSTAIYPVEFMNEFFKVGYGLPMMQGVQMMRTILFGSYDVVQGRAIGVLFGWLGGILLLQGLILHLKIKKAKQQQAREKEAAAEP